MKINGSKVVRLALVLAGLWGITVTGWARRPMRLVVLPDIQTYLEQCPEVFESQIDWIVAHRRRIDAVVQVGDLTQNNSPAEWFLVREQFRRLDRAGIPFGIAWGNHDLGSGPGKFADVHDTRLANRYFSLEEESRKKEWGGSADGTTLDNYYLSFRAAGASGNRVYQMLANFQRGVAGSERGGNGYLRLIDFDPDRGVIDVQTYSTWEKSYHPSPAHRFTFEGVDFKSYRKR